MGLPMVIKKTSDGERAYDIHSMLLEERIVMLTGGVDDHSSESICAQLLHLDTVSSDDISFYINSPGGVVTSGLAIYDTMNLIQSDVATYCIGQCASMGAHLLSNGEKGKRFILPSARVMIHQPLGGAQGQASDIEIQAAEIIKLKKSLAQQMADNCDKPLKTILKDIDRDFFLGAEEAKKYGIVDHIINKIPR